MDITLPLKRGDVGPTVRAYQDLLVGEGYLNPEGLVDVFGPRTERSTIRVQVDYGLRPTGIVTEETLAVLRSHDEPPQSAGDGIRFIQAKGYTPALALSRIGRAVTLIVVHTMENANRPDTAEAVAAWFAGQRGPAPEASAHECVDADSEVRCVQPGDVAWGAPGANWCSYHIEQAGFAKWPRAMWLNERQRPILRRAAARIAAAARLFDLPVLELTDDAVADCLRDAMIRQGKLNVELSGTEGGVVQHRQLTRVWQAFAKHRLPDPRTLPKPFWPTHVDCGDGYPMDWVAEIARS